MPRRGRTARPSNGGAGSPRATRLGNRLPATRSPARSSAAKIARVAALYRKYRPQDFDEVVGQEAIVRTLKNAISSEQVRQAYLFAGPRGTGKTSLARILAKGLNCVQGPTPTPDKVCNPCVTIANGTSLDVIEMDAASQRGIDDIREIRERVVLQPAEGRYKVYILDEAHQLTDAAWNALLKLIEEPPPHLVFVFCTTDLSKVLPTVRSRCQTFVFSRPRLPELVRKLRRIADGEGINVPDQALALIARSGRGAYRDAESTLDQLASATEKEITVQSVLQLLGAVEEEALFRLCDLVVDRDTAGALTFIEELSEQGQDLGRLVVDLLEHLRHLMLVQHMGEVPDSLPVTEETRDRLRAQANQLGEATVIRLVDLLAVAVEDMRQGGDPRLPLELALVRVTRPGADLSRESIAYRLEQLESRGHVPASPAPVTGTETETLRQHDEIVAPPALPSLELEQLQEAWQRTIVPAVEERSIPAASVLREAHPADLADDTLTVEFPASAAFHRQLAEEPKNATLLAEALYEVTGRHLGVAFAEGEARADASEADDEPAGEEKILELVKETLDARERED
ncbi:MAG: DNA polymerase III subunit gamma/tau [Actinobacteria bacterium]|nr:MAG: DNA polymerase III subunit gamma/tau [Actinomycetota bacterium]